MLKIPDLVGPLGDGIRGQVIFGSVLSGVGAYLSVRFLTRYFANRSLRPFALYCVAAGAASLVCSPSADPSGPRGPTPRTSRRRSAPRPRPAPARPFAWSTTQAAISGWSFAYDAGRFAW